MDQQKDEYVDVTIGTYDAIAQDYASRHQDTSVVQRSLDYFASSLNGRSILDAGCGPGRDTRYFVERDFEVTGVDLSPKMLAIAKRTVPAARFQRMNLTQLDLPPLSFDGIWCCAAFQHIAKTQASVVLEEYRRVLKPLGVLFISVPVGTGESYTIFDHDDSKKRFFAFYQPTEISDLLIEHGFSLLRVEEVKPPSTLYGWVHVVARKL